MAINKHPVRTLAFLLLLSAAALLAEPVQGQGQDQAARHAQAGLPEIRNYITSAWDALTRSMTRCQSITDPKASTHPVIYLPADLATPAQLGPLARECHAQIAHLPRVIHRLGEIEVKGLNPHALLYLPYPYVVPGGMFNEMYGWDSYFIIRGLLESGRIDLARGMVENFFFEIGHYGALLNANRAYMLTRSQPPFLTSMILAVYDAEKAKGRGRDWLAKAYPYAAQDHDLWVHDPHLAGTTGLSRYFDFGEGPVAEEDPAYYRRAAAYFILHPGEAAGFLSTTPPGEPPRNPIGPRFSLRLCPENASAPGGGNCDRLEDVGLTADFYKGDRSVRESGFDITFRFGPYAAGTHHDAAVGLNCLLYKAESDLERISTLLGKPAEAGMWRERARQRRNAINQYLWNAQKGEFFDYDFTRSERSSYEYATAFYPLWVGLASPEQAQAVDRNFSHFDRPGGLLTSLKETGAQWDAPYGWAPLQLIAAEGLRRYGFADDANRLSAQFLTTVLLNFRRDGTIREKYNVVTRSSETHVQAGYTQNVVGFGWTNGVFLALLHSLPPEWTRRIPLD
jgi:alpha,alpha-trehalase